MALIKKSVKAKDKKETIKQADYMIEYMNDLKKAKVLSEAKGKYKVGDKITTKLDKKEQLHGRSGKVKEVGDNTLLVDFGNGDTYGIQYSRLDGNVIVEAEFDKDLVAKLAKKAFGKDFDKVEFNTETASVNIVLKSTAKEVRYADLVVFDKNSTSFKPGDIHFHKGQYNIEVKVK